MGCFASGPLMVWIGQRNTVLIFLPIAFLGWFLLAFSQHVWLLLTSRVISGAVVGVFGVGASNFVAEISHSKVRGRMAGLVDLFRQIGFLFVYVIGSTNLTWRETCIVCGVVTTVIPFLALLFLPNSPRWLATKSRSQDARKSLKFYRGKNYCVDSELSEINNQLKVKEGSDFQKQIKIIKEYSIIKRLTLLCFLFFAYQFTGNFSMITFSVTIFKSVESSIDAYTGTIIVGVVRVFAVLCNILITDRVGRRPILIVSLIISSISIATLGAYYYLGTLGYELSNFRWLPLVSLAIFIYFICIAEPALILFRSELLPNSVRSLGVSIIYTFFFTGAFLVTYLFPVMMANTGPHGTFWAYALTSLVMAVVVAVFIPETKNKSLEEIEKYYEEKEMGVTNPSTKI